MCTHKYSGKEEFTRAAYAAKTLLSSVGGSRWRFETSFFDSKEVARFLDIWDGYAQTIRIPRWPMVEAPPYWSEPRLFVVNGFASDAKLCIEVAITRTGVRLRAYESIPPLEADPSDMSIHTVATLITSPGGDLESNSSTSNGLQCTQECDVTVDLRQAVLRGVGVSLVRKTRVLSPAFSEYASL